MVVSSEQAGPHNMVKRDFFEKFLKISKKFFLKMLAECTATRVGGEGEAVPFTIIDNGY